MKKCSLVELALKPRQLLLGLLALMGSLSIVNDKALALPPNPVDVVLMFDLTGSISDDLNNPPRINDLAEQKAAALAFIEFFATKYPNVNDPARPKIGVGTMNNLEDKPGKGARILAGGELTKSYDALIPLINSLLNTGGATDISEALNFGAAHLLAEDAEDFDDTTTKFLVLLSDGQANRPGAASYTQCAICGCQNAQSAAELVAEKIRAARVEVIGVHYIGHGQVFGICPGEPQKGIDFMQTEVSYLPDFFYSGNGKGELKRVFDRVACAISCDDGDPCTLDSCDVISGACRNVPDDRDLDNDGRLDCGGSDTCYGDDALLGTACQVAAGQCTYSGQYTCGEFGSIVCGTSAESLSNCDACSASFEVQAIDPVVELAGQYSTLCNRLGRVLRTSSGRNSLRTRRFGARLPKLAIGAYKSSVQQSENLKSKNFSCNTKGLCVTMPTSLDRQIAQNRLTNVSKRTTAGLSLLRQRDGKSRSWRSLSRQARGLRSQLVSLVAAQSVPYKVCE